LAERVYKPMLQPGLHKIIGFAQRTQGLMVAPGNPLQLHTLQDLVDQNARFVNRTLGSGTRVVLDELLTQQNIAATRLQGYQRTEPSHTAVAHAVAAGHADVGLGIEVAARAAGLDFVPLVQENYHLVCLKSALHNPAIEALSTVLQSDEWQRTLAALPGYTPQHSGQVLSLRNVLPWWEFARKKR
jgi:putative molybdopterin biosynthesis protein